MVDLAQLQDAVRNARVTWQKHALQRMLERDISREAVRQAILQGEIIETYPDDYPSPSCLICQCGDNPLHVVVAYAQTQAYIITVYKPDAVRFQKDGRKRNTL